MGRHVRRSASFTDGLEKRIAYLVPAIITLFVTSGAADALIVAVKNEWLPVLSEHSAYGNILALILTALIAEYTPLTRKFGIGKSDDAQ